MVADQDTINLGYSHGFQDGDAVIYRNGGGDSIGGLMDGATYYVIRVDDTTVQLAEFIEDTGEEGVLPLDLDTTLGGSGDAHSLRLDLDPNLTRDPLHSVGRGFDPATAVTDTAESIDLGYAHGFKNGQAVVYSSGGDTPIGGLQDGAVYYVVTDGSNPNSFQLAASQQDALQANPVIIDLDVSTSYNFV